MPATELAQRWDVSKSTIITTNRRFHLVNDNDKITVAKPRVVTRTALTFSVDDHLTKQ